MQIIVPRQYEVFKAQNVEFIDKMSKRILPLFKKGPNDSLTLYHGTSSENADEIIKEGFHCSNDGFLGGGVYLSPLQDVAKYFGSTLLQVQANLRNTARLDNLHDWAKYVKVFHSIRKALKQKRFEIPQNEVGVFYSNLITEFFKGQEIRAVYSPDDVSPFLSMMSGIDFHKQWLMLHPEDIKSIRRV